MTLEAGVIYSLGKGAGHTVGSGRRCTFYVFFVFTALPEQLVFRACKVQYYLLYKVLAIKKNFI
jgi:hypothetical protein